MKNEPVLDHIKRKSQNWKPLIPVPPIFFDDPIPTKENLKRIRECVDMNHTPNAIHYSIYHRYGGASKHKCPSCGLNTSMKKSE